MRRGRRSRRPCRFRESATSWANLALCKQRASLLPRRCGDVVYLGDIQLKVLRMLCPCARFGVELVNPTECIAYGLCEMEYALVTHPMCKGTM